MVIWITHLSIIWLKSSNDLFRSLATSHHSNNYHIDAFSKQIQKILSSELYYQWIPFKQFEESSNFFGNQAAGYPSDINSFCIPHRTESGISRGGKCPCSSGRNNTLLTASGSFSSGDVCASLLFIKQSSMNIHFTKRHEQQWNLNWSWTERELSNTWAAFILHRMNKH